MRTGRGACTAKHILLRDLLRRRGEVAEVELVEGDFAAGIPQVSSMTAPLRDMLRNGRVCRFSLLCHLAKSRERGPSGCHLARRPSQLTDFQ